MARLTTKDVEAGSVSPSDESDAALAFQLGAGVGYALTRSATLSVDDRDIDTDESAHSAVIGVRYGF